MHNDFWVIRKILKLITNMLYVSYYCMQKNGGGYLDVIFTLYPYIHGLKHGEIWNPNKKIRIHIILPFVGKHVKAVILYWQNSSEQHVLNISSILQPKKCTCTNLCKRDAMLSTTYLISKFYTISKKKSNLSFLATAL